MRILLIGDDTQSVDLPIGGPGFSARCNAILTPAELARACWCVFDQEEAVEPADVEDLTGQTPAVDSAAIIYPYSSARWLQIVRELPERLQTLLPKLSCGGAVAVPTDRLSNALPLEDVQDPLQAALDTAQPGSQLQFSETVIDTVSVAVSLPELIPDMTATASRQTQERLARFVPEEIAPVESAADAIALIAGLFLMHDCLDRSHSHSQDVQGQGRHAAGDYWHAIMHRREPDYGNSKYWYRHVGRHPVFDELLKSAAAEFESAADPDASLWQDRMCAGGEWNPFTWVDFCEHVALENNAPLRDVARRIQWIEMLLLLRQTAEDAYGAP